MENTLKSLDLTAKKLEANTALTEQKINKSNLTIQQLTGTIGVTQKNITTNKSVIGESLNEMYQMEQQSPFENFLVYKSISDAWDALEKLRQFERNIHAKSEELIDLKDNLTQKKTSEEIEREKLSKLQQDLSDQRKVVQENAKAKAAILAETKNQEASYRKILAEKEAVVKQYEKDLFEYESQLKLITDSDQIPKGRHGILSWPVDSVYITQEFGVTNASARLYVSGSHNGVDFRATIGTPVKAALGGTVVGTGNTDEFKGCYSFGRWVMIKHPNGLSTIYGHLSLIKATVGQQISTGDVIGLSGYSGYVAPPGPGGAHLHLGVYATAGVQIKQFTQSIGCKQAIVPIADVKAYLDPLLYLPTL